MSILMAEAELRKICEDYTDAPETGQALYDDIKKAIELIPLQFNFVVSIVYTKNTAGNVTTALRTIRLNAENEDEAPGKAIREIGKKMSNEFSLITHAVMGLQD